MLNRKGFRDFTLKWKLAFREKEVEWRDIYAIINYSSCCVKCFGDELLKRLLPAMSVPFCFALFTLSTSLNNDRNLFVWTHSDERNDKTREIMLLNVKTSLNDMLISASFGYGQLKSIKNQSHPHFHFDTHRSWVRQEGKKKDKLNKTSTRDEKKSSWGYWMFFFSFFF